MASSPIIGAEAGSLNLDRLAQTFLDEIRTDLLDDKLIWPSVPAVMVKIRNLLRDPDASARDITLAISADPALSTKLLRVANSVYYAQLGTCKDLRSALVRLGNKAIDHVLMMLVAARVFSVGKRGRLQPRLVRLFRHSTLVAALCEVLAGKVDDLEPEVAMLAGLIHDIGAMPVLVRAADKAPSLFANPALMEPLVVALHCQVGSAMLEAWRFPKELVEVAGRHEDLSRGVNERVDYVDVVVAANVISHLGTGHPHASIEWSSVPAFGKLGLEPEIATTLREEARKNDALLRILMPPA